MSTGFRTSGDLSADRRYLWAEGARTEGDAAGAADLFRQAVELAPEWATGWFAYGRAALDADMVEEGRIALQRYRVLEPADMLGAAALLALSGGEPGDGALSTAYVTGLFDAYADRFDAHLTESLGYIGPEVVRSALEQYCSARGRPLRFEAALDLGCGTGLMAGALDGQCAALDGIDLSPRMLDKARALQCYRALYCGDIVTVLQNLNPRYDLVIAADVLVYFGDLAPVFAAVRRRMDDNALFAFTAQRREGDGYGIGEDMRFSHAEAYIRQAAHDAGFGVVLLDEVSTRRDAGRDVPGLVAVLSPLRT